MKALSVQLPWAWAILNWNKPVENRTWSTSYRGPLAIHAGKKLDYDGLAWIGMNMEKLGLSKADVMFQVEDLPRGGFVGIVDLVDCVQKHDSPWFFGPNGLVLANPRLIEFIPFKGKLGLFDVPEEIEKAMVLSSVTIAEKPYNAGMRYE